MNVRPFPRLLTAAVCAVALYAAPAFGQEGILPIPANVKAGGMPPIPASIQDDLSRYAQFREAQLIGWAPSRRQILIQTKFGDYPQIHQLDGPGRARLQLTFLPRGVATDVWGAFDPADGNTFLFRRDAKGGREADNLYRYDLTTGDITLVTDGKSEYGWPVWAHQGKWIAYDSTERNGRDRDLYVMQPADPKSTRRLGEFQGNWDVEDWSPDGTWLVAMESLGPSEARLWRIDVKTGERRQITPAGEKGNWFEARCLPDGRVLAVSDRVSGVVRIWRSDASFKTWTPITPENKGINAGLFPAVSPAFALSSDGLMLAVVYDRGDDDELEVYDVGTMKPRPLPALPPGQISRLAWRPGSRELGFTLASLRSQGDVYSIDAAIGTLSRWTDSETSGFNPEVLPPPEVIKWKSKDGMTISGILYRPTAGKFTGPRPVMINIHGGPSGRERARFIGRGNYFLNELGIALIYPNVRGSIGFGPEFEKADDGKGRMGAIEDIGALLDWIAAHPEFDKNRVMLTGASYGGWLSLEAGIVYGDKVRCIFEGAGITDFVTFMQQTDPSRLADRRAEYGDERDPDMRAFLESISPLTRSADLKVPTFIAAGARDSRVPVAQARQLVEALKGRNVPVWYTEYADAGHDGFPNSAKNYDFLFNTWALFIKHYLLN